MYVLLNENFVQKIEEKHFEKRPITKIFIAVFLISVALFGILIIQRNFTNKEAISNRTEKFLYLNEIQCRNSLSLIDKLQTNELSKHPYIARIIATFDEEQMIKCGGILITKNLILTAAHCLQEDTTSIHIGSSQVYIVPKDDFTMIPHPLYNETTEKHDIGLIKLHQPIENIITACLPQLNTKPAEKLKFLGFSDLNSIKASKIRKLELPFVDNSECNQLYKNLHNSTNSLGELYEINDNEMCAGGEEIGEDSKPGDSGMPLFSENKVYAIVKGGNGEDGIVPGIYTKICPYLDWIASIADRKEKKYPKTLDLKLKSKMTDQFDLKRIFIIPCIHLSV